MGGKPRHKGNNKRGRGTFTALVLGMVERNGDARFQMLDRLTVKDLEAAIAANADLSCRLITDELQQYHPIGRSFVGGHEAFRHGKREYVRKGTDVHT